MGRRTSVPAVAETCASTAPDWKSLLAWCGGALLVAIVVIKLLSALLAPRKLRLRGKCVVITGGSSGIGLAIAKNLAQCGATTVLIARKAAQLEEAKREVESMIRSTPGEPAPKVLTYAADVGDADALTVAIDAAAQAAGGALDALVCSAGITQPGTFETISSADWERMLRVNVLGSAAAARAALPHLKRAAASHGAARVCFISSQAGQLGVFGYTSYSASKFALRGLAEALAMEVRPHGVRVTLAHPPDTDTPMLAAENEAKPRETALISDTSGVFAADAVAAPIVRDLAAGTFLSYVGLDGWMLAHLTAGMSPVATLGDALAQVALMSTLRLVSLFYLTSFDMIVSKEHRARQKP